MNCSFPLIAVLVLLLTACNNDKKQPSSVTSITRLTEIVENTELGLKERLNAARSIDSLTKEGNDPVIRITNQQDIGLLYLKMDSMSLARQYFREVILLAGKQRNDKELAIANNSMAIIFNAQSAYDSALVYYEHAYLLFSQQKDTLKAAQTLVNIGIALKNKGDYETAFRKTLEATSIFKSIGATKELAYCYTTLGNVLKEMKRYDEGLAYHEQALEIRTVQKDSSGIAACLNNIGNIYRHQKKLSTALQYYLQSYAIKKKDGKPKTLATALDNIAETYLEMGQDTLAESYFKDALDIRLSINDKEGYLTTANRLANLYLKSNQLSPARTIAMAAASVLPDSGFSKHKLENTLVLKELSIREGNYRDAVQYAQRAIALKDSVFSKNLSEAVTRMNTEFQTAEKQKALEVSRQLESAGRVRIRTQRYFIVALSIVIVLLLSLTYLLYRSNEFRKEANRRIDTLKTELEHRVYNNLQRLSFILLQQMHASQQAWEVNLLKGVRSKVEAMIIVHATLYRKKSYDGNVNAPDIIRPLLNNLPLAFEQEAGQVAIHTDLEDYPVHIDDAITLGLILNEFLTNIYKHTRQFEAGAWIKVGLERLSDGFRLSVSDNGPPWKKEQEPGKEKGQGLMLIESLVEQLDARYEISSNGHENVRVVTLEQNKSV